MNGYNPDYSGLLRSGERQIETLRGLGSVIGQNLSERRDARSRKEFGQQLRGAIDTGNFNDLLSAYPDQIDLIQNVQAARNKQLNDSLMSISGKIYSALDRGDTQGALSTISYNSRLLNSLGDPEAASDNLTRMLEENPEQLKQLARSTFSLTGGDISSLSGSEVDARPGTFRTIESEAGQEIYDTRTGEKLRTVPGSKETKRLFKVKDNDDGSVTKYFSDGTEEIVSPTEKVKTPDMKAGMSLQQAQKVLEGAKEYQSKSAGFALRLRDSIDAMKALVDPKSENPVSPERVALIGQALRGGTLANLNLSPEEQQYATEAKDALFAILRPETGAAITSEELAEYSKIYLPQPGDSEKANKTKLRKLENQFNSLRARAPRIYDASRIVIGEGPTLRNEMDTQRTPTSTEAGRSVKSVSDMTNEELLRAAGFGG